MTRFMRTFVAAVLVVFGQVPALAQEEVKNEQALVEKYRSIASGLHPQKGSVKVPGADAVLLLDDDYYFLIAPEAKVVLTEAWGNPPDAVDNVLGMIFPTGKSFVDDTWGAVVTYNQSGYVSDEDAGSADYDAVITSARENEDSLNAERAKHGFSTQRLVGWAQPPSYDSQTHSLIWARNIRFGDAEDNTLNYDIRMLGRRGVLSLNMVSSMKKLPEIRIAASQLGKSAAFDTGARYADYNSSTDSKAEYGLAGLVAGGMGVAAAKKLGILAIIAGFGKKFIVILGVLLAAAANWGRKLFRRDTAD